MNCPICNCTHGTYSEIEDFNPGSEYEWSMSYHWCCDTCKEYVSSYDDKFEWPED